MRQTVFERAENLMELVREELPSIDRHKIRYMYHEAKAKFWAYQKIKDLGA